MLLAAWDFSHASVFVNFSQEVIKRCLAVEKENAIKWLPRKDLNLD